MLLTGLVFVAILSVLVLAHELGHFLAAKLSGIKVEEFGLGLPPRLLRLFKIGETEYTINWLPIGGFVKLYGEDGEEKGERAFYTQSNLTKAVVLAAGVAMNFVLGFLLMAVVIAALGAPQIGSAGWVTDVQSGSPAQKAGLLKEDEIIAYGLPTETALTQVQDDASFIEFVKKQAGFEIVLDVKRCGNQSGADSPQTCLAESVIETQVKLTPRLNPPEGEGALGIAFVLVPTMEYQPVAFWRVPMVAMRESFALTYLVLRGIGDMAVNLIQKGVVPQDVAGPVGIAKITSDVAKQGLFPTLQFAALLSINLGVINVLPFPALDGGRLLFVGVEAVLRRPVHPSFQRWVHTIGILILLTLMLLITFYDIVRVF